jgi:hypothetical protein
LEELNLKKISMRGNYFSRTLWKLSFTYGIQGSEFYLNPTTHAP